jgi:hypothetical protein
VGHVERFNPAFIANKKHDWKSHVYRNRLAEFNLVAQMFRSFGFDDTWHRCDFKRGSI